MPNEIEIYAPKCCDVPVEEALREKHIAFAYPGMFAGIGDDFAEAMQMAKMRYRNIKKKFLETRTDATERDWLKFALDRQTKISSVYAQKGLTEQSVWSEDNVDKTT